MGSAYSVGPLHKVSYLEPVPGAPPATDRAQILQILPNTTGEIRPMRFRSPRPSEIIAWRDRISAKYRSQLQEDLVWDEEADFNESDHVASSGELMLRYVAAVLDGRGSEAAARALRGAPRPPWEVQAPDVSAALQRGFAGRFPHLLLGTTCWLPYRNHLIIE